LPKNLNSKNDNIPASKIAEHQYCALKTYCEEVGLSADKKQLKKQQRRMEKGTKEHEKIGKSIERQKKTKEVSFVLILIFFGALIFMAMLGLLFWVL